MAKGIKTAFFFFVVAFLIRAIKAGYFAPWGDELTQQVLSRPLKKE